MVILLYAIFSANLNHPKDLLRVKALPLYTQALWSSVIPGGDVSHSVYLKRELMTWN